MLTKITSDTKCGAYMMVCATPLSFFCLISLIIKATIMGSGNSASEYNDRRGVLIIVVQAYLELKTLSNHFSPTNFAANTSPTPL